MQDVEKVQRLGGRWIHRVDRDGVSPAIVLLGGCGVPSYRWSAVMDGMAGQRVVALDRPGLVDTSWPGRLPTLGEEVSTLAELIEGLDGRAVLVGHSMGGLHAEALARLHPELVVGLVLADSSVDLDPAPPGTRRGWYRLARLACRVARQPALARVGSLLDRTLSARQSNRLHWYDRHPDEQIRLFRRPDTLASVLAEQAAYDAQVWDLARLREQHPWPDIATVVLSATGGDRGRWLEMQTKLARLLNARHVAVRDSRHLMMVDRPDLISAAALRLAGGHCQPRR